MTNTYNEHEDGNYTLTADNARSTVNSPVVKAGITQAAYAKIVDAQNKAAILESVAQDKARAAATK